jgi:hypothetical protein
MITLATLEQATAQEVFDQVAEHLLKQGKRCQDSDNKFCVYRNDEGLKCAAGCLIGDDEYNFSLESNTWFDLTRFKKVPKTHDHLIRELQKIHDEYDVFQWREELATIAQLFQLDCAVIDS